MHEVFEKVREIVNARLAVLRECVEGLRSEGVRANVAGAPSETFSRKHLKCSIRTLSVLTGRRNGNPAPACRRMPAKKLGRLLDPRMVPSSKPRPPDLRAANLSFAARLVIAVRDKFSGDAPSVYAAAKVSRQAYSQIISDETRPVCKRTAIRFAFALRSTPEEARLLLKSAGYAFSNSLTEDFILQACLKVNPPIWDLDAVNMLLEEYHVDFQY